MHNADNHGVEADYSVERKVFAHHNRASVRRYRQADGPELRIIRQALAFVDNTVDEAVCSGRISQRHMEPEVIKVRTGAGREDNAGQGSGAGGFVRRQALTSTAFEVFKVERLALAAVNALSPEPAQRFDGGLALPATLLPRP